MTLTAIIHCRGLRRAIGILAGLWLAAVTPRAPAQEARIHVYPSQVTHELSRYMTGTCSRTSTTKFTAGCTAR